MYAMFQIDLRFWRLVHRIKHYLRERFWNATIWYSCDDLLPYQGAKAKEDTPNPLLQIQRSSGEGDTTELNDRNLKSENKSKYLEVLFERLYYFSYVPGQ